MKTAMLAILVLVPSIGLADAHQAKHRLHPDMWQATAAAQKPSQSCSAEQGPQARINTCGEYIPSIYDPSPVSDH